jgi:hypothetical protein
MSELKPCPLCGQEIYSEFYSNRAEEFDGHCTNKKCLLYGKDLLFFNTAKWNTRPIEDQLRSENKRLRAENERFREALQYIVDRGYTGASYVAQQALDEVTK